MHPQLFPLNLSPVPNLLSQLAGTRLRPSWGQVWTLMGSVSLEQPRAATPPTPVPTPVKGAAALAWVRGPHTTGNTLSVGNLSDLILLMSTMEPALETMAGLHRDQLQAAYLDLSQCSSRPPASSFHATNLLQRWLYIAKTQLPSLVTYSKLRHWSVSGTDHHTSDNEFPYRLL